MTDGASAAAYLAKPERCLASARMLLEIADSEGAVNRAYYAMFDAAHAALWAVGLESETTIIKSHASLIAQFGKHLVLSGRLDGKYGRALNQVEHVRQLADYVCQAPSVDEATWAVDEATAFFGRDPGGVTVTPLAVQPAPSRRRPVRLHLAVQPDDPIEPLVARLQVRHAGAALG